MSLQGRNITWSCQRCNVQQAETVKETPPVGWLRVNYSRVVAPETHERRTANYAADQERAQEKRAIVLCTRCRDAFTDFLKPSLDEEELT